MDPSVRAYPAERLADQVEGGHEEGRQEEHDHRQTRHERFRRDSRGEQWVQIEATVAMLRCATDLLRALRERMTEGRDRPSQR